MATEELLLVVNDAQLKAALTQINMIKSAQTKTRGQVTGLTGLIAKTRRDARAAGINLDDLPTLNRDLRLIGGLFPGFREASTILFQGRRGVLAAQRAREAAALLETAAALEKKALLATTAARKKAILLTATTAREKAAQLGQASVIGQLALLVVIVTTLLRLYNQSKREIEQNRGEYERLFREGRNISHEEYKQLDASQIGYATRFDEFEAKWMSGEQLEAIAEYVRSYMLTPWLAPKGIKFDPYDPYETKIETSIIEIIDKWWENVSSSMMDAIAENDYKIVWGPTMPPPGE